jgi:hypothetical protein
MNIQEMIAMIDADLAANDNVTDERIAELHSVVDAAPIEELLTKETSPRGTEVIARATEIRTDIAKRKMSKAAAESLFYRKFLSEFHWGAEK